VRESALFYWLKAVLHMAQSSREALVARVTEIAERVGQSEGIEVVEVEYLGGGKARVLRITIDKPTGVTHGDCELISQQVGTILDVEDLIPGANYHLEVSSPGVERKLSKPVDFERFSGHKAKISLTEAVDSQRYWEGVLRGITKNVIALEPSEGKLVYIPLESVRKANLKFEW
jgi:ribosome maturation factor RimP